jgi:transcriptional regulator with XRE-family HTH domain
VNSDGIYLKEMGNKIRATRKVKGLVLRSFAKECGLDYSGLCKIATGLTSPLLLTLKKIADNLDVDVKDFL